MNNGIETKLGGAKGMVSRTWDASLYSYSLLVTGPISVAMDRIVNGIDFIVFDCGGGGGGGWSKSEVLLMSANARRRRRLPVL